MKHNYFKKSYLTFLLLILFAPLKLWACDCDGAPNNLAATDNGTSITFTGDKSYSSACGCYQLEVELALVSDAFDGSTNLYKSNAGCITNAGNEPLNSITISYADIIAALGPGEVKWRIRQENPGRCFTSFNDPVQTFFPCTSVVDSDGDGFPSDCDCDDNDPDINPYASELCDGIDNNCDSLVDNDVDGDGYTVCMGDCDDDNKNVYPGASEVCDGLDNNCDGFVETSTAYDVPLADTNLTSDCGAGNFYTTADVNIQWTSNGTTPISSATIEFLAGVDCNSVLQRNILLNGKVQSLETFTSQCTCSPTPELHQVELNPDDYIVGGNNVITIANVNSPFGLSEMENYGVNIFAKVCVDYGDSVPPSGYSVSIDQTEINETNQTAASFTFAGAEVGTTYNYNFSSENGGTDVTGSGTIAAATDQITGINLSGLEDGTITLSVTLTDAASNQGAAVADTKLKATNQAPVAVCKAFTAQLDASGNVTISPEDLDGGSSDDKAGFVLSIDQETFDCSHIGTSVDVTLTVTDSDGVKDTCIAEVTVEDNIVPTVNTQDVTLYLDENGQASIRGDYSVGPVAGQLEPQNSLSTTTPVDCDCPEGYVAVGYEGASGWILDDFRLVCKEVLADGSLGTETVETCFSGSRTNVTRSDMLAGNEVLVGFEVQDGDFQHQLSSRTHVGIKGFGKSLDQVVAGNQNNIDNSALAGIIGSGTGTTNLTTTTNFAPAGHAIVGMSVNQTSGYSSSVSFKYAPISSLLSIDNGSTDNCKIASIAADVYDFTCADIGVNTVTLTVTDVNGNESSATAAVTVEDNTAPQAIAKNITIALDANGMASITPDMVDNGSSDNCTATEDLQLILDKSIFGCEDVVDKGVTPNLSALNFDGNDYVSIPDSPELQLQGDMTIEAWFKVDEFTGDWVRVVGKGAGPEGPVGPRNYGLWYLPNGTWLFQQYGEGVQVAFNRPINVGEWYHMAAVKTGNVAKLYINGEVVASNTGGTSPITSNDPLTIGYAGFHDHHIGQIDEVRLWNIARTDEEILNDFTKTLNPDTPGLLAYYNMEEASGDILNDQTVNGFNGDLQEFSQNEVWTGSSRRLGPVSTMLTVTDESGNSSSAIAIITVEDNIAPEVLTQDITVELDASGMASIAVEDIDNGSNDACGIESLSLDTTDFTCENIGENIVTLTAMDVNGNESSATATVTVEDNATPMAIAKDITVQLDENGAASITPEMINNGSSDNCTNEANLIYSVSPDNFSCEDIVTSCVNSALSFSSANDQVLIGDLGAIEDWTIEFWFFNNGNINYQNMFHTNWPNNNAGVRIEKSQNWPNGHLYVSVSGDGNFRPNTIVPLNGALSINEWHHVAIMGDKTNNEVIAYLDGIKTTENANNSWPENFPNMVIGRGFNTSAERDFDGAMDEFRIWNKVLTQDEVTRNMNNSLTGNEDNLIHYWNFNDGAGSEVVKDIAGNRDGVLSGANVISAWIDGPEEITTICGNEVVLSVTDESGNTATATAIVTVEDNIAAEVLTQDITIQLDENGMASIEVSDIDNGSNDACGIASLELDVTEFTCENVGPNTVTLTAKDNNGNESSATATVTVEDHIAAEVLTQDITIQLDENGMASIEVSDIDNGSNDACGIASLELDITDFTCDNVGPNTVTLTAKDNNENESSATATVTVDDNIAAEVLTQDITIQLDENGMASIEVSDIDNGSNDACGIESLELDVTEFTCDNVGPNAVTLTATDVNGNISSATATVTVEDNIAAEVLTQDITIQLDENGMASIEVSDIDNGSNDACGIESLELDNAEFTCDNVGPNTVTLTATDVNGNISTANATVTVEDNFAAVVITQNITIQLDENGMASIEVADIDNGSNDACGIESLELDVTEFTCENVGPNTVTLTAKDNNGNESSATATVTVEDNIAAEVLTQDITIQLGENGMASIEVSDIDNGSNDACGIESLELDNAEFTCDNVGPNTVTLTATDVNGNISSANATVTVEDNIAAEVLTQDITIQLDENGMASIEVADIENGSNDACGIASLELDVTEFTCENVGPNAVTLTVTDVNGNESSATAIVTVEDNLAPVAVMDELPVITTECEINEEDVAKPLAIDNCDESVEGVADIYFPITRNGSTVITWTFEDANGNKSYQQQEVIIIDTMAPEPDVAVLEDIIVECEVSGIVAPTATDICEGTVVGTTTDPLSYSAQGEYIITWTFEDASGNVVTQEQKVIVKDVTAPVVETREVTVVLDPEENVSITPEDVDNGSYDNCSEVSLSLDQDYFTETGMYEVILTATDANGNSSQAPARVLVVTGHPQTGSAHVVPTILKRSNQAKVIIPFREKITQVQVLETETNKYKLIQGNKANEMEIDVAPFKGTLLVRIIEASGKIYLKKLIAL